MLSDSLLNFYAGCFHNGNKSIARIELNAQHNEIRARDSSIISFTLGSIAMLVITMCFFWILPNKNVANPTGWTSFYAGLDAYYFTYIIIWIIFATGVNIQVFRKYSINYTFIFEMDKNYKLIHHQLFRIALSFSAIWMFCLAWDIGQIKIFITNPERLQIFTILLLVLFILICLNPMHCFYQRARVATGVTLWNILISPFGLVRFRHFFLADVITSMVTPI